MVSDWLELLGGIALFTVGLSMTGAALKNLPSGWIRHLLLVMTRTAPGSVGLGVVTTLLAGSSSAISVVAVGFVQAGLLTLKRALDVILGAAIGTTLTVQLVSFGLIRFAPLLILAGAVAKVLDRGRQSRPGAELTLGFGFIFYGMMVMVGAVGPLARTSLVVAALKILNINPWLGFLAALAVTAFIQNSATVIALAMTFRVHGLIDLPAGLTVVLGANVGSTAAAMYSALLGGSRPARRVALAYSLMKAAGAGLFWLALPLYQKAVVAMDPNPLRTLADAHTLFNLVNALIFLPLTGQVAGLMTRWLPDPAPVPVSSLDLADHAEPAVAFELAQQEIGRLAESIGTGMMSPLQPFLHHPKDELERQIRQTEAEVDLLHHAIHAYLFHAAQGRHLAERELERQIGLLYLANHLEHFSDTVIKVVETRTKLTRRHFAWTPLLWTETENLLDRLTGQYQKLVEAIRNNDDKKALALVQDHPELLRAERAVRLTILTRPDTLDSQHITLVLELSDDLAQLLHRLAAVSRALLGVV